MLYKLSTYVLIFMFYSFLGWIMEVIVTHHDTKKWVNRGFLIGPVCPIYGWGCLSIIVLLSKYLDDPLVLFLMAIAICSVLEYMTSWVMEKMFNTRWWDYSDKKFNINGRICLSNLAAFGLLSALVMYFVNPLFLKVLGHFNIKIVYLITGILLLLYVVDSILSFMIIRNFKKTTKLVRKDSTEEITKKVKEILMSKNIFYRRLAQAFNFTTTDKLLKEIREKMEEEAKKAALKANDVRKKGLEEITKVKNTAQKAANEIKEKVKKRNDIDV